MANVFSFRPDSYGPYAAAASPRSAASLASGTKTLARPPAIALELSWKAMTLTSARPSRFAFARAVSSVPLTKRKRLLGISSPSTTWRPEKNQWRECSEFDWDMS